jgi:SAM-dependent methyltransferase
MNLFQRSSNPHALVLGMTAIKMGDRLLQLGCAHGGRLATLAGKVGLSGRACAQVETEAEAARARKAAAQAGVLVEVEVAPLTTLPFDADAFDLLVIDDTGDLMGRRAESDRAAMLREALRVLRPGGRVLVIEATGGGGLPGLSALFGGARKPADSEYRRGGGAVNALHAGGFRSARLLAEREGLAFTEGMKTRG